MKQLISVCFLALVIPTLVFTAPADSAQKKRSAVRLSNPALTAAVLRELMEYIVDTHGLDKAKRDFDGGYGSRFASASNYGNKLMALQAATDWQGPGRKRRGAQS
ncbi:uncharacterized protein LOC141912852 [Tubulanus polymorphus]|uniref:uncharacterized protein LOC141912852 n=1 Tax=Tubulanus polymorphus TaxID=672921 RepID=UPI003DA562DA